MSSSKALSVDMRNKHITFFLSGVWRTLSNIEPHRRCQSATKKGLITLTGLWSKALGSEACMWQVVLRYLMHLGIKVRHWPIYVRFNLYTCSVCVSVCVGGSIRTLFKIHKLTSEMTRSSAYADIFLINNGFSCSAVRKMRIQCELLPPSALFSSISF